MKTKITFEVNGSNKVDIERRALTQIAEFLGIEPDDVEAKCDIELHIEPNPLSDFKAIVYVRVK
jgi:adenylate cyclase class IV